MLRPRAQTSPHAPKFVFVPKPKGLNISLALHVKLYTAKLWSVNIKISLTPSLARAINIYTPK
jgi:hypothetical protein